MKVEEGEDRKKFAKCNVLMNIFFYVIWVIAAVWIHVIVKIVVSLNFVVLRRILVNIKQPLILN